LVLGQANPLAEWADIELGVTSALTEVEALRSLDRLRVTRAIGEDDIAVRRQVIHELLRPMEVVELSPPVLRRAGQPLPVAIGTLDALHLSTALLWRDFSEHDLVMATHDLELGRAARAMGLAAVGC